MVDLVLALTAHGLTRVGDFYLDEGEVYLRSNHGAFINHWDATAHYACYLAFTYAYAAGTAGGSNDAFRFLGLWWAGSVVNSLIVFLPGGFVGRYGELVKPSYLLNAPYLAVPFAFAAHLLSAPQPTTVASQTTAAGAAPRRPLAKRPADVAFAAFFAITALACVGRALVALGASAPVFKWYATAVEPYLADTTRYPQLQMLLYFFYGAPFFVVACMHSLRGGSAPGWLRDGAALAAGAVAQGQWAFMGGSLYECGPSCGDAGGWKRVPPAAWWAVVAGNGLLLLVPQLFAWRLRGWTVGDACRKVLGLLAPSPASADKRA
jgi:hypothetical protein